MDGVEDVAAVVDRDTLAVRGWATTQTRVLHIVMAAAAAEVHHTRHHHHRDHMAAAAEEEGTVTAHHPRTHTPVDHHRTRTEGHHMAHPHQRHMVATHHLHPEVEMPTALPLRLTHMARRHRGMAVGPAVDTVVTEAVVMAVDTAATPTVAAVAAVGGDHFDPTLATHQHSNIVSCPLALFRGENDALHCVVRNELLESLYAETPSWDMMMLCFTPDW